MTFASTGSGFDTPTTVVWNDTSATWGNINNDGNLDLVTADGDGFSPTMTVRVEDADGRNRSFGVRQPESYGSTRTQVLGDFDGDGKLDIAQALNSDEDTLQIWMIRNNGTRFERPKLWFTQETWQSTYDSVRPGDFDEDGKDDLAVFRDQAFDRLPKSQLTHADLVGGRVHPQRTHPRDFRTPASSTPDPVTGELRWRRERRRRPGQPGQDPRRDHRPPLGTERVRPRHSLVRRIPLRREAGRQRSLSVTTTETAPTISHWSTTSARGSSSSPSSSPPVRRSASRRTGRRTT